MTSARTCLPLARTAIDAPVGDPTLPAGRAAIELGDRAGGVRRDVEHATPGNATVTPEGVRLRPRFVAGSDGSDRFLIDFCPQADTPVRGTILCVQPFGDEATLSRRVLVAQAIRLAARGWVVRLADVQGTGDSAGEDQEATLAIWRDDLDLFARGLRSDWPERDLVLWGVRLGCALACDLMLRSLTGSLTGMPATLVFWQPGRSAADALAPWLRLAGIGARTRAVATTADGLVAHDTVAGAMPPAAQNGTDDPSLLALGGFYWQRDLIEDLSALPLTPVTDEAEPAPADPAAGAPPVGRPSAAGRVLILGIRRDLGRLPGGEPPPELAALARRWGRAGYDSDLRLVTADSFWNSLEPSTPVAAFEATESFLLARP